MQVKREETVPARMKRVRDLSRDRWAGRRVVEGYTDTIPVLATTLDRLRAHGPLGPVWWRYGHQPWQTLTDALANADGEAAYQARDEQHHAEDQARRERERRERREREEARRPPAAWPCPTCGRTVYPPDPAWGDSEQPTEPGDDCTACARSKERERQDAEARAAAEAEATTRCSPLRRWFG